jgi:hypothetical protein
MVVEPHRATLVSPEASKVEPRQRRVFRALVRRIPGERGRASDIDTGGALTTRIPSERGRADHGDALTH